MKLTTPDNENHQPGVVPLPAKTFEATMTPEAHAEMMRLISEAEQSEPNE